MPNIVFRVPEGLLFGYKEFGWVVGWVGSKVFTLRWVGLGQWFGRLGWINWTHGQLCSTPRRRSSPRDTATHPVYLYFLVKKSK